MKPDKKGAARPPRVLIVSEHASVNFGGEAILPWHYFRLLRARGIEAWLIVHERTRKELVAELPSESDRMHFTPDTRLNIFAAKAGAKLPAGLANVTVGYISRIVSQRQAKAIARELIAKHDVDVVHQPMPVSPRETSLLHGLGVPVVIGPMNGNMTYPPAFAKGKGELAMRVSRKLSNLMHRLMPGKRRADVLLVANSRTRGGLPTRIRGEVVELAENGVDLSLWKTTPERRCEARPVRFVFLGRLIELKRVDILLEALARVPAGPDGSLPHLEILGDGPVRSALEEQARQLEISDRVHFQGRRSQVECAQTLQQTDAMVFASIHDCGGAVVLEAMATGLPIVSTDWGGPQDYLDSTCGFLIPPTSREAMVEGFADAMTKLAADPELRDQLGRAGRQRVESHFDWEAKIDEILKIYQGAIARHS